MDSKAILAELFAPLRFASRDGFARAGNLRDVGRLVAHVAGRAREAGCDGAALDALAQAATAFDQAPAERKGAEGRRILAALEALIPLPPELAQAKAQPAGPVDAPAVAPAKADVPAERREVGVPGPPPAGEPFRLSAPAAPKPRAKPAAAAKERRAPAGRKVPAASETEDAGRSRIGVPGFAKGLSAFPLEGQRGVGPQLAAALAKKGISSAADAIYNVPRGYQDRRRVATIAQLVPGEKGLTLAQVVEGREIFNPRSRKRMLRVVVADSTGRLALTFFHYWPSTLKRFTPGKRFFAWGEVKLFGGQKQIVHPDLEEVEEGEGAPSSAGRIVPVYRGMDELGQGRYRALVRQVLEERLPAIPEILPEALVRERNLPSEQAALRSLHVPDLDADAESLTAGASPGHRRLAYEELLLLSLGLALKARGIEVTPGHSFDTSPERIGEALSVLPFAPTGAQRRAIEAIAGDMARREPMNRLLQGDVGSGKTAVALVACLLAVLDGRQAALMAPTELLAEQHHRSFGKWLESRGIEVALLATGRGQKALTAARQAVSSGRARIAIGTHALMSEGSIFQELGLVVIDEQHRFGVEQRAELIGKGIRPDVLVMTATPIPRTLSLVLHGELTQTVIDELPPGRTPIRTKVFASKEREKVYRIIEQQLGEGRQAYVVYPLIEESERSDLEDATRGLATLQERFPGRRLDLLHGRMKAEERDAVMARFRAGEVDLLVSTTVIEVGVDVPNATVMVVEHAERFGLSQLHQLRGRVGRGSAKSACLLVDHGSQGRAQDRLAVMEETTDGFRIAAADLEIRGPGEFLGTRQAGLPELDFADLSRDARLLEQARADAFALVRSDPDLSWPEHRLLRAEVFERFAKRMSLAQVG
ncbi:ATP-dependent DNA helicase RecG [Vulgatibacter incomptus]|uniref:ATP-dependent DNA helicase RecG n=1 Tax=Vulgatibacter incomptus TaxID=1391653 RepID=A0A0K1PBJ3_9BACT|nr:ATP-dependent DNA helicase RecG [Vulgatibacter incomptus]AKU90494.1 ATP-dependent DNA helicase RecG [Vulgatibacter incomptus]